MYSRLENRRSMLDMCRRGFEMVDVSHWALGWTDWSVRLSVEM